MGVKGLNRPDSVERQTILLVSGEPPGVLEWVNHSLKNPVILDIKIEMAFEMEVPVITHYLQTDLVVVAVQLGGL